MVQKDYTVLVFFKINIENVFKLLFSSNINEPIGLTIIVPIPRVNYLVTSKDERTSLLAQRVVIHLIYAPGPQPSRWGKRLLAI